MGRALLQQLSTPHPSDIWATPACSDNLQLMNFSCWYSSYCVTHAHQEAGICTAWIFHVIVTFITRVIATNIIITTKIWIILVNSLIIFQFCIIAKCEIWYYHGVFQIPLLMWDNTGDIGEHNRRSKVRGDDAFLGGETRQFFCWDEYLMKSWSFLSVTMK